MLSVLPFAHIYENTNVFGYLLRGAAVYVNRRIEVAARRLARGAPGRGVRRSAHLRTHICRHRRRSRAPPADSKRNSFRGRWTSGGAYKRARARRHAAPGPLLRAQFALAHALVLSKLRAQLGCDRLRYLRERQRVAAPRYRVEFRRRRTCRSWKATASPNARRSSPSTGPAQRGSAPSAARSRASRCGWPMTARSSCADPT